MREADEKLPYSSLSSKENAMPVAAPHKTAVLALNLEGHRIFPGFLVSLWLSLIYTAYVKMCKVIRVPAQSSSVRNRHVSAPI